MAINVSACNMAPTALVVQALVFLADGRRQIGTFLHTGEFFGFEAFMSPSKASGAAPSKAVTPMAANAAA